ncbi:uncharacterized protein LOC110855434 [Folsomia candida]|nr:uncharacterized protein LOC110855434 [Folsomia candida]
MTDRQVNTDFNRVASLLGCSVCLDMCASGRVLQCKNGHNICGVHIAQLASCPVCRDRYVGGPSRNLVAEAMVAIHRGVGVEDAGGHGAELPNRNPDEGRIWGAADHFAGADLDDDESPMQSNEEDDFHQEEDGAQKNNFPIGEMNLQDEIQNVVLDVLAGVNFDISVIMGNVNDEIQNALRGIL